MTHKLSVILAVLLIAGYGLGLLFSLKTHREIFSSAERAETGEPMWPLGLALATLAVATVFVALVSSDLRPKSVEKAAETFGIIKRSSVLSSWRLLALPPKWSLLFQLRARTDLT